MEADKLLKKELKYCFKYFYENTNLDINSLGFGLTYDKYPDIYNVASISATGYALASLVIAINNKWLSYEEGYYTVLNTLHTLLNLENKKGFFYRYINRETGEREFNSEISIIDTGILLCGCLSASEYFKGEIKILTDELYKRINWNWYVDKKKNMFRLGYKPKRGFYGYWDNYAEQLILYILGSGSPTYKIKKKVYYTFERSKKNYEEHEDIIHSWFGSLFTYQYSHAWIDFRSLYDEDNVNWYDNSLKATLAHKQFCLDNAKLSHTFKLGYWGLSPTISKDKYRGRYGAAPYIDKIKIDGTISLSALISSIIFCPKEVKKKILKLYNTYPKSFGKYGFVTSINLKKRNPWFASEYLGIDKGTTMIMLENYFNNTIWNLLMDNKYIKKGMKRLNIAEKEKNGELIN